ncbi:FkbM family methyltransferase [Amylibacter sp.]|nr:FkbM family methyltransferase [Amylibacter sp.]
MKSNWRSLKAHEIISSTEFNSYTFGIFTPNYIQKILIFIGKKSFLKRGLFRTSYSKIILSLKKRPLDVYFRKCAYRITGENNLIEYGILLDPKYNFSDLDFLLKGAKNNSNFVDIGSNIGLYSQPLAFNSPDGLTVSIDANPNMISKLKFNINATKIQNIKVISTAVSDIQGKGSLKIRKDDVAIVALDEDVSSSIKINTLENIIKSTKINSIFGLKIDIEGHEDKALVPFLLSSPKNLLPKKIVIEQLSKNKDYPGCKNTFDKLNYKLVGRSKNNSFYELSSHEE